MTSDTTSVPTDDVDREIILDHYRRPRHRGLLPEPAVTTEGVNPGCGDTIKLSLLLNGNLIERAGFKGSGCAISQASASLMADAVYGSDRFDARALQRSVEAMIRDGVPLPEGAGDIEALRGVAHLHARVKCALLPWKVLGAALDGDGTGEPVSTE